MVANKTTSIRGVSADCGVVTSTGIKRADSVRVGDEILTESGEYERVTEITSTGERKQTVYKLAVPLVSEPFEQTLYVAPGTVVYGLPQRSDMATEIAVSKLTDESYIYLPNKVKQQAPILSYQLRGSEVVSDDSGVFIPVGRVVQTTIRTNLLSFTTDSGSFIAGGITIRD